MTIRVAQLLDVVCARTGVTREELRGPSRERHISEARALVYYLARTHTRLGWRAIARYSTGKDGMGARQQYEAMLARMIAVPALAVDVSELDQELLRLAQGTQS